MRKREYAANLARLSKLVLFMFENDITVQPRESSWFGFWDGDVVVPLRQQRIYKEDWIGLKALDKAGRLTLATVPGAGHMQFTLDWFEESVIRPYLAPSERESEGTQTAAGAAVGSTVRRPLQLLLRLLPAWWGFGAVSGVGAPAGAAASVDASRAPAAEDATARRLLQK